MLIFIDTRRSLRIFAVTTLTAFVAVALVWALVWTEIQTPPDATNWLVFGVMAVLLLVCERTPATWIQFGPVGAVTPLWMFAFALMLLGAPSLAVATAVLGSTMHALLQIGTVSNVILRVSTTALSLSASGLVLAALGVRGAITRSERVPWDWAIAIVAAGVTIVVLNAAVAALAMSVRRGTSFVTLLRRGLAMRVTAEGALLSLAPIWVIGIDFSVVLVPFLGITTILVFRSTRQALERSHEAFHDPLTGLLNRRAFIDHLAEHLDEARPSAPAALLIMDLNNFKDINDRLGHQIGDALLVAFADRLEASLPNDATTARLGGDEFAVLIPGPVAELTIDDTIDRVHAELASPLSVEGFPVTVAASVGVAMAPDDGLTPRDLLRAADVAMYRAKRTGNAIERYNDCVKGPQRGRLNLLSDLGDALANHELFIHFQPQLRMSDGSVDTVEALIRWHHPEHGSVPPGEFIGLAEQTDLIGPITDMVLRVATQGMLNAGAPEVRLAVNVSPRSLQDPDFASSVFAVLSETGFSPDRLELEVTERALVSNAERTTYTIARLRDAGVRIAIDDFGVGYSSYQTLRTLEVDRVKIDRDFVVGILTHRRDQLIVASLIRLAHDLGLDVVAEGVEDTPLWDAVAALGCDIAQGYGIATPMAFPELRGWLSKWNDVLVEDLGATAVVATADLPR